MPGLPESDAIVRGEALDVVAALPDGAFTLIYLDPPFNTGRVQRRRSVAAVPDPAGSRGFGGRRYARHLLAETSYEDRFDDYPAFLQPHLQEARRLLADDGTLYLHVDYREAHYCKLLLDGIFGRASFLNEIVWAYDFGGRPRRRWPAKHDTILVYVRDPARYHFDAEEVEREPYMAPGLAGPDRAARGKLPTDVWWHTIVSPTGREKTGYPTQKPVGILRRMVAASTRPGDRCLDFFAGSGTLGAAAEALGRRYLLVDRSEDAVCVMRRRLPRARYVDAWPT